MDSFDAYSDLEHLARAHAGHLPKTSGINAAKLFQAEGVAFDVELEEVGSDWEDDVSDFDILPCFPCYNPDDIPIKRHKGYGDDEKESKQMKYFDAGNYQHDFREMEKSMESLNEEGTLKKLIIKSGTGHMVPDRCKVFYHYMGIAEGCLEPFTTSLLGRRPVSQDLRVDNPLIGLMTSLKSMALSEIAQFIIYPELAYGPIGCPPRIPPNCKVLFVVQLLQYIGEEQLNTPQYMSPDECNTLPFKDIYEAVKVFRRDGNSHYSDQNYFYAVKKYQKGISMLESYSVASPNDEVVRMELLSTLYSNLAVSYVKMERPAQACVACKTGLKFVEDSQVKAKLYFSFASAKYQFKDHASALKLIKESLNLNRDDIKARNLMRKISESIKGGGNFGRNFETRKNLAIPSVKPVCDKGLVQKGVQKEKPDPSFTKPKPSHGTDQPPKPSVDDLSCELFNIDLDDIADEYYGCVALMSSPKMELRSPEYDDDCSFSVDSMPQSAPYFGQAASERSKK